MGQFKDKGMKGYQKGALVRRLFGGAACWFVAMLVGCGHSFDLLPDSQNTPTASVNPSSSEIAPNDFVGKAMAAIDSPNYQGELVFSLSDYSAVQELQKKYPEITFKNKFGDPVKIDRERRRLEKVAGKKLPDLRRHIVVAEKGKTKAKEILKKMAAERGMQAFRPEMKLIASGISTAPDLTGQQGYLSDLNIPAVWVKNVKGENITIYADESTLNPNHEDLPENVRDINNENYSELNTAHGTATFGILVGLENGHGVTGIAPNAQASIGVPSIESGSSSGTIDLSMSAYPRPGSDPNHCISGGGDPDCVSGEYYLDLFEWYQILTAFGIPAILSAGNGSVNMDTAEPLPDWPDLRQRRNDSGAIMVGASMGATHNKASFSNCGSRVDLFAWGAGVVTTSYPGAIFNWSGPNNPNTGDTNTYFTNQFGGTSAASAIITGTVSLLQSYAIQKMGSRYKQLAPAKIREILVNSGISATDENGCSIGKQPRMDVAMSLFDNLWTDIQRDFPEIRNEQEIKGARRQTLRQRGIQLVCNYHRPDLSDVNCPETAKCVLFPQAGRPTSFEDPRVNPQNCQGSAKPACIDIDYAQSDYDCAAGAIWPTGVEIAKPLDFDGDKKADLVSWTKNGWKIDLSSVSVPGHPDPVPGHPELVEGLGAWDLQITPPVINARWVWPVAEDYNSDGRADLAVYDKEHGVWYIKFTTNKILNSGHGESETGHGEPVEPWTWDREIPLPYHDELNRNVWIAKYGRPVPGDYNGDGYIDLAIARSDGIWSIDFGGPNRSDYGQFDQNTQFLTAAQLREAPGWAYLPVMGASISFKVPDGVTDAGKIINVIPTIDGNTVIDSLPPIFGGNDLIPSAGGYPGYWFGIKNPNGLWQLARDELTPANEIIWILEVPQPNGVFGGSECQPFLADCDGDDVNDRSVMCPSEFRVALSSTGQVLHIPLGYNTNEPTLPGKPYFGGISYQRVQQLIQFQLNTSPAAPIIPVDMVQTQMVP